MSQSGQALRLCICFLSQMRSRMLVLIVIFGRVEAHHITASCRFQNLSRHLSRTEVFMGYDPEEHPGRTGFEVVHSRGTRSAATCALDQFILLREEAQDIS
jgi:hypothetical protein